ncbi:MAG: hypothetical protein Fur0010_04370 [Bdellovibrio sp.]
MSKSDQKFKLPFAVIFSLSIIVFIFLIWFIYLKEPAEASGNWVSFLPYLNSTLNFITSILLVSGYRAIKKGQKELHQKLMYSSFMTSALFLMSYLLYHHFHGDTKFTAEGLIRYFYFFILISHILLSMVQVPLILMTFFLAYRENFKLHKKWAKWTFPIWLYVSVTGVLIFFLLKIFN